MPRSALDHASISIAPEMRNRQRKGLDFRFPNRLSGRFEPELSRFGGFLPIRHPRNQFPQAVPKRRDHAPIRVDHASIRPDHAAIRSCPDPNARRRFALSVARYRVVRLRPT